MLVEELVVCRKRQLYLRFLPIMREDIGEAIAAVQNFNTEAEKFSSVVQSFAAFNLTKFQGFLVTDVFVPFRMDELPVMTRGWGEIVEHFKKFVESAFEEDIGDALVAKFPSELKEMTDATEDFFSQLLTTFSSTDLTQVCHVIVGALLRQAKVVHERGLVLAREIGDSFGGDRVALEFV